MKLIIAMEEIIRKGHQKNWDVFLSVQKSLVEKYFDWIGLTICAKDKALLGKGILRLNGKSYTILISYSPFHYHRYDRIFIFDRSIKYHRDIHLYSDLSLCLYHPVIDQASFQKIPLLKMIPWVTEWIVFYEQWKKYGVWLGKEIKH